MCDGGGARVCVLVFVREQSEKNTLTKSHRNVASSDRASERVVKPIPVCHGFPWQRRVCLSVSMSHTNYIKKTSSNYRLTHTHLHTHARTHAHNQDKPGRCCQTRGNAKILTFDDYDYIFCFVIHYTRYSSKRKNEKVIFI